MLCQVFDDKFDVEFLHAIYRLVENELSYTANNVANATSWPHKRKGSHRLFGCNIFDRNEDDPNRILYLNNKHSSIFFDIFDFLCNLHDRDSKNCYLKRISVNLQHSGCDGTLHLDSFDPGYRTIMLFINPEWKPEWGGQFQLFSEDKSTLLEEYDYVPGRVISFPSNLPHRGLGPKEEYIYRYSIVFDVR